jgi:NSS family neurotransmitter:Na+ symporter
MGIQGGIEKWSKILMPAIFGILILLIIRGITLEGASEGINFLVSPDWSKITSKSILAALGQAFFSLSLGMGTMITYGSYLSKKENLTSSAATVVTLDTAVALLAGFAIFPALFALGGEPASGAGLVFITLPGLFDKLPLGALFSAIFFVLLFFAALTSAISILECVVAYTKDQLGWERKKGALVIGGLITLLGVACSLSNGVMSGFTLPYPGQPSPLNLMDWLGVFTDTLLPLGGLFICLFIGFKWKVTNAVNELTNNGQLGAGWVPAWKVLVTYICPIIILFVLLNGLGILG